MPEKVLTREEVLDNPEQTNALVESLTKDDDTRKPIAPPPDTQSELPGGLLKDDGSLIVEAEVRELTGEDEEYLAKALVNKNQGRLIAALLERGVVSIGAEKSNPHLLKNLLVGDRDTLLLAIRKATYGKDLELKFDCPMCGEEMKVLYDLDTDVPMQKLEDPYQREWRVELRHGGEALVRLPNGYDQEAILEQKLNTAESNSLLLFKCIKRINGTEVRDISQVQKMGIVDRNRILKHIIDVQPGPHYEKVTQDHAECGESFPLVISLADLFRGE